VSGERPVQRDCRNEPAYPGMDTVVFLMWAPDYPLTVHAKTELCQMDYPHEIEKCGEWAGAAMKKQAKGPKFRNPLTKREMALWLRTFGGCHERMCPKTDGWGFCDCILAVALREFEKLSIRRRAGPARGRKRNGN
jgi:hypothetical protein